MLCPERYGRIHRKLGTVIAELNSKEYDEFHTWTSIHLLFASSTPPPRLLKLVKLESLW
ncbi:uncharacterized protein TrAtP1_002280 [Trichoderma atroviride]|uniref:uncharacterized protein n=1 Tax=Hypocrea atroviridis TaxID=63577 RepID=UPI0033226D2A|nr:hypothetical protein TrAtP1_002280 [Trichoderma atroviride]